LCQTLLSANQMWQTDATVQPEDSRSGESGF
jgi:hypothetical protein